MNRLILFDVFGIGAMIADFVRGLFWGMIKVLMSMVTGMLDALINGVLSFGVLNTDWVTDSYNACFLIMFMVIPVKLIYEILFNLLTDNDQGLDVGKKLSGTIVAVMIAVSLPTMTPMVNTLTVDCAKVMTTDVSKNDSTLGDALLSSVFVGFGGMAESGPHGSKELVKQYQKSAFSITERGDNDEYVWDFSELMVIVGMVIYVVLLFAITIQVATRVFMVALLHVMGPVCCTSLTKFDNPNAFNVWKSSLLGQWAMNFAQITGLSFLANMVGAISKIGTESFSGLPVTMAQLALYFGAFSLIITLPNFIQAMIGGYASGALEAASQMQSAMHMMKAGTIGLASGGIAAAIGRRNSYTGHREGGLRGAIAGNKRQNGTRTGGIVGNTIGQKDAHGNRQGGIRGAFMGDKQSSGGTTVQAGGLRGGVIGSKAVTPGKDGTQTTVQSGGVAGAFRGRTTETTGQKDGQDTSHKTYSGGLRGMAMGTTTVSKTGDSVKKSRSGGVVGRVNSHRATSASTAKRINIGKGGSTKSTGFSQQRQSGLQRNMNSSRNSRASGNGRRDRDK